MADGDQVLREMVGTPFVWLYTANNEILRYFDGEPIIKYVTEFRYKYDEDNDDKCEIKMEFETLRGFDLPYVRQDVILKVQWGYILDNSRVIRSPVKEVAVRDIQHSFKDGGISLTLVCTDLASYSKSFQLKTTQNWSNPTASTQAKEQEDIDRAWQEYFNAFVNDTGMSVTTTDEFGVVDLYDAKVVRAQINNTSDKDRVKSKPTFTAGEINNYADQNSRLYVDPYYGGDTYMGHSNKRFRSMAMGWAVQAINVNYDRASRNLLEILSRVDDPLTGGSGKTVVDSTDRRIDIRKRNFRQAPFKTFTFYGTTGELIEFNNNTQTNRTEVNRAAASTVNPYNKKIETNEVIVSDQNEPNPTENNDDPQKPREYIVPQDSEELQRLKKERIRKELAELLNYKTHTEHWSGEGGERRLKIRNEKVATYNYKQPTEQDNVGYQGPTHDLRPPEQKRGHKPDDWDQFIEFLYQEGIRNIANPEDQVSPHNITPELEQRIKAVGLTKEGFIRNLNLRVYNGAIPVGSTAGQEINKKLQANKIEKINRILASNYLMSTTIEQIIRKYNAKASVVGDPSLINGKTYSFNNLGPIDSGKWYASSVEHVIIPKSGYMCEMGLWRAPKQIFYSNRVYSSNPQLDEESGELILEETLEMEFGITGTNPPTENKEDNTGVSKSYTSDTDSIASMEKRLEIINEFNDFANGNV